MPRPSLPPTTRRSAAVGAVARFLQVRVRLEGTDAELRGLDLFVAGPTYASMAATGYTNEAVGFDVVHGHAQLADGQYDQALLYDSPGDDTFIASPSSCTMEGAGYRHVAHLFDFVHAYGSEGREVARFYDPGCAQTCTPST